MRVRGGTSRGPFFKASDLPADVLALEDKLSAYVAPEDVARVREAYRLGAVAHEGQTRKSGEPYITHPVAVATILADMRLDHEAIAAAILHDTLEDTPVSHEELEAKYEAEPFSQDTIQKERKMQ